MTFSHGGKETKETDPRQAAHDADGDADGFAAEILHDLADGPPDRLADALEALAGYRTINPDVPASDLTDAELDALAWAEAMETVFRGRPSAIIGPIPR